MVEMCAAHDAPRSRVSRQADRWQRGQTLVVVAVMMVALVGFLALVIDGGNVYAQRRQMQNAADAGALAGARSLALSQGQSAVISVADQYARANGAEGTVVTPMTRTVTVVVTKTVPTYFARVINIHSLPVSARATARIYPASTVSCGFLPLTIPYREPEDWPVDANGNPALFSIWDTDPNPSSDLVTEFDILPSYRGWLNIDYKSPSSSELSCLVCRETMCGASQCAGICEVDVEVGWIEGSTGSMPSVLKGILDCLKGSYVYIPLYDDTCCYQDSNCPSGGLSNGKCNYEIVGFAPFYITDVKTTGNPKGITGRYAPDAQIDDACVVADRSGSADDELSGSIFTIKLIQ